MKKKPCLRCLRPRRTGLTRVDLHEVGDLLALTNSLVQLHNLLEAPKWHLTNLGDTTLQKTIDSVVDDELLALLLQMIVSPTLKHSHRFGFGRRDDWMENKLGKARNQGLNGWIGIS